MSYEYKVYHKETGEEIHKENFSQYFSQYIALDSDGDLVEIDSRDAVVVSVIDFAYIKFNKTDECEAKNKELLEELQYLRKVNDDLVWQRDTDEEHEAKAKAWDKYKAHMERHIAGEINEEEFVSDLKSDYFESSEPNADVEEARTYK